MFKLFIFLCVLLNILGIQSSPKGRHWEYGTKIKHPPPKHHHYGDDGKGWSHSYDSGSKGHEEIALIPIKHEIDDELPLKLAPIHVPKHEFGLGLDHEYSPKEHIHYEPIAKHVIHYEPKKVKPKKKESDSFDKLTDINIDGIIDDIQKDLKKTDYIAKA